MAAPLCPCGSTRKFSACCGPFLAGTAEAPTPEAFMRSRFSAFAKQDVEYLWRTLHPTHPDRAGGNKDEVLFALRRWAGRARFKALQVLDREEHDPAGVARVLFLATIFDQGRDASFAELSDFLHDGTGWRYVGGAPLPRARIGEPGALTIAAYRKLVESQPA